MTTYGLILLKESQRYLNFFNFHQVLYFIKCALECVIVFQFDATVDLAQAQ